MIRRKGGKNAETNERINKTQHKAINNQRAIQKRKKEGDLTKEQITIKMYNYLRTLLFTLVFAGCNSNIVYDQYYPIELHQWSSENKISFQVNSTDTISKNNVFIHIRNNKNYEFSALFLIAKLDFPNGFQVIDTLEYEMTDLEGNWLGSGFTDIKENKLFYKENVVFSEKGTYNFEIRQVTRAIDDIEGIKPLKGITDVGLKIEKK